MYRVYLIGAYGLHDRPKAIKIGIAKDPSRRLDELQTGNHLAGFMLTKEIGA